MQDRFLRLTDALSNGLHERTDALKLGLLALLSGESLFLLGPPGTAKSLLARRLKGALHGARAFEYLMGRFSTPEEIFGPFSIAGLRDRDVFERRTTGYLPEADVAFLDEVWRASPPIQNTLLTILNEKRFRNGGHELSVPLKLLVAASNQGPHGEESADAFWDRFTFRLEISPLAQQESFHALVVETGDLYHPKVAEGDAWTPEEWDTWQTAIDLVEVPNAVVSALWSLRTNLSGGETPVLISDRRWKKASRVIRACASVHGRAWVDGQDLAILQHVLWDRPEQRLLVAAELEKVLAEEGWVSPVPLGELEAAVDQLQDDWKALTVEQATVVQPSPLLFDGEYYALIGYPGDSQARVWAQDWGLLTPDQELDGELFFFSPAGPFRYSEPHSLRATGASAEVEVDGRLFALESQQKETLVSRQITPRAEPLKQWKSRLKALREQTLQARTQVERFRKEKLQAGMEHIFCPSWAQICARGLERDDADLGELLVRLETLLDARDTFE